jgi:hypothetical protein
MFVILHAFKKWCPYLIRRHFKVKMDHDSLKCVLEQLLYSKDKQKWVTKMLSSEFEIIYKKKENIMLWQMPFEGRKKKQKVHYVLFLFYNLIGWKNQ